MLNVTFVSPTKVPDPWVQDLAQVTRTHSCPMPKASPLFNILPRGLTCSMRCSALSIGRIDRKIGANDTIPGNPVRAIRGCAFSWQCSRKTSTELRLQLGFSSRHWTEPCWFSCWPTTCWLMEGELHLSSAGSDVSSRGRSCVGMGTRTFPCLCSLESYELMFW